MSGLHNYGLNCYMNAVIQALRYTRPVLTALLARSSKSRFVTEFENLLFQPGVSGSDNRALLFLLDNLSELSMDACLEHDAHEFLLKIVDKLFEGSVNPMCGQLTTTLACVCGHTSKNSQLCLVLSIDGSRGVVSGVQQCCEPETVTVRCEHCNQTEMESITEYTANKVLVLHLQRFDASTYGKRNYEITLLEKIELCGRMWTLVAMVNHYGSTASGHYTTTARTQQGWCLFNDEVVECVDNLPTSNLPYILFYVAT
jgi:ubiquitin C-terminal hydrolase